MRFCQSTLALLGALASTARAIANDSIVAGAYIVEFDGDQEADSWFDELRSKGIAVAPRMTLKYKLFNGASFSLEDDDESGELARQISANAHVKALWPVRQIQMPKVDPSSVGQNVTENAARALGKRAKGAADTYSTHVMTQVDKLRAEGYTGKGVRVGVVDTGIDYRHPALGGCYGKGCLVEYGYDFTGDEYTDGSDSPTPDDDPLDTCQGHGTHVAGIIMAQENELGFTGAAPDVTLGMYKVSGCPGYTTSEILVSAFYMAYEDGSNVISCSAGDDSAWATDVSGVAVSRIVEAGVPVVVAAGNSGNLGLWMVASPASGVEVAGIGSVDNTVLPTLMTRGGFSNGTGDFGFGWMTGHPVSENNVTLRLWAPLNVTDAGSYACDSIPTDMPDLNDTVILLQFSKGCQADVQAEKVVSKGGQYILYYPELESSLTGMYVYTEGIEGVAAVSPRQAAAWIQMLKSGEEVEITITPPGSAGSFVEDLSNGINAGLTSAFSSWGPTWEGYVKPQLTAPGGGILSTWTWDQGAYMVNPGTSMSTPMVAAVYALVGQARGTFDPKVLSSVLSLTAQKKPWSDGTTVFDDILAPVAQQGAGLVQAYDAAHASTLLSVNSFSLNDTDNFVAEQSFTIRNTGSEDVAYSLGHTKAVTVYTFTPGEPVLSIARSPPPTVEKWAELTFDKESITVPAGSSAEVSFVVAPPTGLNATLLPIYSGYITLKGDDGENVSVPYLGVAGSMHDTPVVRPISTGPDGVYLSSSADHFLIPVSANKTFTIPRPGATGSAIYPKVVAIPTVGTKELRIDLVALGSSGNATTTQWKGFSSLGQIPGFPIPYATRIGYTYNFAGFLADRTVVPEGSYSFIVSGVRIFGDAKKEEDWDVVETVPFNLKYLA